jgi:hypothetical protein
MGERPKVEKLRMTRAVALAKVRAAAAGSSNLQWSAHMRERMSERDIDDVDVLRILRLGDIEEDPIEGTRPNEWKVKITHKLPIGRVAGVVAAILENDRLRLVTAEWEDKK